MNLILLDAGEVATDGSVTLEDARAAHIVRVLSGQPGQTLRIGIIDGPLGTGTLTAVSNTRVSLTCAFAAAAPPLPQLDLLLALPRPKVLRRLWAQLAALGVRRIMLTNAERVERNYFDTHLLEARIYHPLLVEGLQQARTRASRLCLSIASSRCWWKMTWMLSSATASVWSLIIARRSRSSTRSGSRLAASCWPSGQKAAGTISS